MHRNCDVHGVVDFDTDRIIHTNTVCFENTFVKTSSQLTQWFACVFHVQCADRQASRVIEDRDGGSQVTAHLIVCHEIDEEPAVYSVPHILHSDAQIVR